MNTKHSYNGPQKRNTIEERINKMCVAPGISTSINEDVVM